MLLRATSPENVSAVNVLVSVDSFGLLPRKNTFDFLATDLLLLSNAFAVVELVS